MKVYRYETPNEVVTNTKGPVIFLAGPTVRGNQGHLGPSWRFEAIELFEQCGFDGTLIVPEFSDDTKSDKGRVDLPIWENNGLKRANCIMFWLCRTKGDTLKDSLIGLNTNSEISRWCIKAPNKVVYGRPDDAYRIQYNDIMWKVDFTEAGFEVPPINNNLFETVLEAINVASVM